MSQACIKHPPNGWKRKAKRVVLQGFHANPVNLTVTLDGTDYSKDIQIAKKDPKLWYILLPGLHPGTYTPQVKDKTDGDPTHIVCVTFTLTAGGPFDTPEYLYPDAETTSVTQNFVAWGTDATSGATEATKMVDSTGDETDGTPTLQPADPGSESYWVAEFAIGTIDTSYTFTVTNNKGASPTSIAGLVVFPSPPPPM